MIGKRSWPHRVALLTIALILALIPLVLGGSPYYLRLAVLMLVIFILVLPPVPFTLF